MSRKQKPWAENVKVTSFLLLLCPDATSCLNVPEVSLLLCLTRTISYCYYSFPSFSEFMSGNRQTNYKQTVVLLWSYNLSVARGREVGPYGTMWLQCRPLLHARGNPLWHHPMVYELFWSHMYVTIFGGEGVEPDWELMDTARPHTPATCTHWLIHLTSWDHNSFAKIWLLDSKRKQSITK